MIGCEKAQELISCLIDGELSEKEQNDVSEHIKTCPGCRAVFDAFSALSDDLSELEEAPEDLARSVMSAIKASPAKRRTPWVKYLSLAACLALVIFAGAKLNVPKSADRAENEYCDDSSCQVICDESAAEQECVDASEDIAADCAPGADCAACEQFDSYAAANDPAVTLVRSDGACAEPDDGFISRLETETKGSADEESIVRKSVTNSTETKEKTVTEPDYTLSLQDGTEYKIFISGDTVTVRCGDRIYVPDLTAQDIESLF